MGMAEAIMKSMPPNMRIKEISQLSGSHLGPAKWFERTLISGPPFFTDHCQ
jgi:hypothetical protein